MQTLHEKIALRRMLQNTLHRLDESIDEMVATEQSANTPPVVCRFHADNIIAWRDQCHVFSFNTCNLLKLFLDAPSMALSKEDVRQDVLSDDDARDGSVRQCILNARKEMQENGFPYQIETITRKGYRLVMKSETTVESEGDAVDQNAS
jgi:DNA-binding winged helix-turn-helix (wHTH) protein